jgi:hypothetical protein
MKPLRTFTPEWEISDWPVKETGTDGKTRLRLDTGRVLLRSAE